MTPRFLLASSLILLLGCPPPEDTEKPDDTGVDDTGEPETFEEGCITIDGEGGYASLNDAIHLADEGATLELCEGTFMEAVVVDKAVHIVGAGIDITTWDAPQGEVPFSFVGVTDASISGVSVVSSRSGIEIEGGSGVALSDLAFDTIANYAVDADDCLGLTVGSSTFVASQWGAVKVAGGSATVSGSTFIDNLGFAIKGSGGAELDVQGNTISGTMYTELDDEGGIADGFALFLSEAGPVTTSENIFEDNTIVSVWAMEGDGLAMSGDSITGGLYGVYMIYGDLDLLDVTITDPIEMGVLFAAPAGESITAEGLQISGDPEVVANYAWDEGINSSIGLYVEGTDVTLIDSTISGYNNYGAYLLGNGDADGTLLMTDVTFDNNGRRGIFSVDLDAVATGLTITNLRELEDEYCDDLGCYTYIDLPAAWYHQSGNLELDGGTFSDNQGWGISAAEANSSVQNVLFDANARSGFFDFGGTSTVQNSSFTNSLESGAFGALCAYQSNGMLAQNNSFSGNGTFETTRVYDDGEGNKTTYIYHDEVLDSGLDLFGYNATLTVSNNSFADGYNGLQISTSDAEIRDNSFSGYAYAAIYIGGEGSDAVVIEDNTVTAGVGYGVLASSADVEVDGLEVTDGQSAQISYDYYSNGKLLFTSSYETSYDSVYLSTSRALLENVTIDSPAGEGIYSYNSVVEIEDVTIRNASALTTSAYAVYFNHYDTAPEIYVNGLTIEEPQGYGGIYLYTYNNTSFTAATFYDVEITDAVGNGVVMSTFPGIDGEAATFEGLTITGAGGTAVSMSQSAVSIQDALIEGNGSDGLTATCSIVGVAESQIVTNVGDGVELSSCTQYDAHGVAQTVNSTATFTSTVITDNGGWGMTCTGADFDSCEDNTLMDNILGDNNGCDESCGGVTSGGDDTAL